MKFVFVTLAALMALTACSKEEHSVAPVADVVEASGLPADTTSTVNSSEEVTSTVVPAEDVSSVEQ